MEATAPAATRGNGSERARGHGTAALTLAALGVVYGDIGTSPLYTIKEAFIPHYGLDATDPAEVLGLLSLIFWALMVMVTLKYVAIIMRADNEGEGGVLALLALVPEDKQKSAKRMGRIGLLAGLVIFGACLLYGDGVITPAISVLSAVEGLGVATKSMQPAIVPRRETRNSARTSTSPMTASVSTGESSPTSACSICCVSS